MTFRLSVFSFLALSGLGLTPALAEDPPAKGNFYEQYFSGLKHGKLCYGHTYDDAHLKEHAEQRVRSIEIDMTKENTSGVANQPERFELGFGLMLRTSPEWYGQAAICKASDSSADCYLEGDGGLFKLTPADGGLRLETGDYGISLEGSKDFMSLSGTEGDDRVFLLKPSREECAAASADFKKGRE
jgi:hypothetical protein